MKTVNGPSCPRCASEDTARERNFGRPIKDGRWWCMKCGTLWRSDLVTAETITDTQIRELAKTATDLSTRAWCGAALRIPRGKIHIEARRTARAKLAEILNTRNDHK